jgi:hypothetical protein
MVTIEALMIRGWALVPASAACVCVVWAMVWAVFGGPPAAAAMGWLERRYARWTETFAAGRDKLAEDAQRRGAKSRKGLVQDRAKTEAALLTPEQIAGLRRDMDQAHRHTRGLRAASYLSECVLCQAFWCACAMYLATSAGPITGLVPVALAYAGAVAILDRLVFGARPRGGTSSIAAGVLAKSAGCRGGCS